METTAFRPSKESRSFDSEQATSYPTTASYIRARAARADLSPDDPIPLFLSDPLSAPDPREFSPRELQSGTRIIPRILAAVLVAAAVAVLVGLFQSDLRNLLAAYAGGWTVASASEAIISATPPAARPALAKDPARTSDTTLTSADTRDVPAPTPPSREAIATAYQSALQAQTPAPAPTPAPAVAQPAPPQPPAKTLDADTLAGLMARAKNLLTVGDIAAARLLLERAANAQDAGAAFLLAQTYDPQVLGTKDTRSISADATAAREWYRTAAGLGSAEARDRLAQLQN